MDKVTIVLGDECQGHVSRQTLYPEHKVSLRSRQFALQVLTCDTLNLQVSQRIDQSIELFLIGPSTGGG